jgi:myo-inositol-1(or 4)-monophosphatase
MSQMIDWPVPAAQIPSAASPVLAAATQAAVGAFRAARASYDRAGLAQIVQMGADGTASMRLDVLVESAVADVATAHRVNLLSEEIGFIDNGSALTLVVDPVDGTANAAAGVPLCAFAAALVLDGTPVEALTALDGAAVSMLRPHPRNPAAAAAWWRVASRAARVRILSTTCLEATLVAEGSTDAFADAGTDTHRIVDLAAAMVIVPAAGGVVLDASGRPLEIDLDLTRRWSGVIAATPELGEELAATIRG